MVNETRNHGSYFRSKIGKFFEFILSNIFFIERVVEMGSGFGGRAFRDSQIMDEFLNTHTVIPFRYIG